MWHNCKIKPTLSRNFGGWVTRCAISTILSCIFGFFFPSRGFKILPFPYSVLIWCMWYHDISQGSEVLGYRITRSQCPSPIHPPPTPPHTRRKNIGSVELGHKLFINRNLGILWYDSAIEGGRNRPQFEGTGFLFYLLIRHYLTSLQKF